MMQIRTREDFGRIIEVADRIVPWRDGERLAREARGPVEFVLIEDGNHVANNRAYQYRARSADWMARQLGAQG